MKNKGRPKKHTLRRQGRKNSARPKTVEEFFGRSEEFQDRWNRVTHSISKMRSDRLSLRQGSREFGLDPRTVVRLGGSALRKAKNGRYIAKASDRLLRVVEVLTEGGRQVVGLRDSRQATLVAEHWNAVHRYLETGDDSALQRFRGEHVIDGNGNRIPLLTDTAELERFGSAGVLSFESIYARTA